MQARKRNAERPVLSAGVASTVEAAGSIAHTPPGRIALVTGASRGIGRAIATALAQAGFDLLLVARDVDGLQMTRDLCASDPARRAVALPLDLRAAGAPARAVDAAMDAFGRLDVLINNAGINRPGPSLQTSPQDWDIVVDLNLRVPFFACQAAARLMAAQGGGAIVNLASTMGAVGDADRAAYCASKSGLVGLTRALAIEWAPLGIRVNAVGPTWVETDLTRHALGDAGFRSSVLQRVPLGRLPAVEDVAAAVTFLASDAARCITGHHLLVDGGWTAR